MVSCSSSTDDNDDDGDVAKRVTATAATTTTTRYPKWRKFSVFWRCVAAFKQPLRRKQRYSGSDINGYRSTLAWLHSYRSQIRVDNYSLRAELQSFLVEKTTLMKKRLGEARWGPFRVKACTLYAPFISLLQKFLLIAKVMEHRLKQMEALIGKDKRAKAVLYEFHRRPAFRSALRLYTARFGQALVVVSEVFAAHKTSELDGEFEQFLEKMAIELTDLRALYRTFDDEYLRARKEIYYQDKQALLPEVLMAMNGFLFFNEWSVSLLENFVEDSRGLYYKQQQAFLPWLMQSLCPSQRHLLPCPGGNHNPQYPRSGGNENRCHCFYSGSSNDKGQQQLLSPLVLRRIRNSACLATSMTIAGYFGLAASRQQPFMAAFTIAYLSGGSVTGMNLVTSINRALGTVLACVYAIAVLLCYEGLEDGGASNGANLFLAFAVVLFQIPCTYLRDRPVLSYAGIVASFSSILLLLDASFDASIAVDRIIDTFIGIVIFLVLELGLNSHASEDVILDDFAKTVDQVGSRFSHFLGAFREGRNNQKRRTSSSTVAVAPIKDSSRDDQGIDVSPPVGGEMRTTTATISTTGVAAAAEKEIAAAKVGEPDFYAKRQLLVYNEAEPASFLRVGKVPRTMLEHATSHLECCHNAISCLSMVSEYCDNHAGTGAGAGEEQDHLLAPLEAHLGDIDKLTSAACAQVRSNFWKLRDKSQRVTYAVPSQLMAMLQDACAGTDGSSNGGDANDCSGIPNASEMHYQPLSAGSIKQLFALDNTHSLSSSRARAVRVDKHNSSCFDCMDESTYSLGSSSSSAPGGIGAEDYLDDLEKELGALFEALRGALSELQQQQLHQQRQEQQAVDADVAPDGTAGGGGGGGAWNGMTNFEVKTVNAYLSSIIDFIHHLGLLAQVVRQMQSHRIIRLGAGNKKHL
jgi:hypothetical protein